MSRVTFPNQFTRLLEGSEWAPYVRWYADRAGQILSDNKLPFFPNYTDHGVEHIGLVLDSELSLIPDSVLDQSVSKSGRVVFGETDVTVLICATLLHDIAMHLRPVGFLELISSNARHQPLDWFDEDQHGHSADRPWFEMWEDYVREARQFSERKLINILGPAAALEGWSFRQLPADPGRWELNHCLLVGEFIRRHHARLAHEIAMYGFPGLPSGWNDGEFPALSVGEHPLRRLADLIGLTARSHGTSLRVCKAYLDARPLYSQTPQPFGTAVLFPMALLRVADYLQIDRRRAPAVLLRLREPQSPISIQEWESHIAVQSIVPADDPRGLKVIVSPQVPLRLFLHVQALLQGLQAELDHSTAVLDEAYGARTDIGLDELGLTVRRVYSNASDPVFKASLPYVPEQITFSTDPNLLTLLVEPLYGEHPQIGVRELMQNAVDAVRALQAWCEAHHRRISPSEQYRQDAHVLVDFVEHAGGHWFLEVTDKGIGMTHDTVRDYFLKAGASFRQSSEWIHEFVDDDGRPRVLRAGRFGIGAFATFLLGSTFRVWTRHVDEANGYFFDATVDSQLIEIQRVAGLPVGTRIEVRLSGSTIESLWLPRDMEPDKDALWASSGRRATDWFCWDWPVVSRRITRKDRTVELKQSFVTGIRGTTSTPPWSVIHPHGFDAVHWTFPTEELADDPRVPRVVCNGIRIERPNSSPPDASFFWPDEIQLHEPAIAVVDGDANLPLTLQRYELTRRHLPFTNELARDVVFSFIAHALVCGPTAPISTHPNGTCHNRHPLVRWRVSQEEIPRESVRALARYVKDRYLVDGQLRWCSTSSHVVPLDAWLYSLLQTDTCVVYGTLAHLWQSDSITRWRLYPDPFVGAAILSWDVVSGTVGPADLPLGQFLHCLAGLCRSGVVALRQKIVGARILCSSRRRLTFASERGISVESLSGSEIGGRFRYEMTCGSPSADLPLNRVMDHFEREANKHIETVRAANDRRRWPKEEHDILYLAELRHERTPFQPESLVAKLWNESLGSRTIPFDTAQRDSLIEVGRNHPDLRRHVEAWVEMKRAGSKWART